MVYASKVADAPNSDSSSNQHVTSQTLTLGRDNDYYYSVPEDAGEQQLQEGGQNCERVAGETYPSRSWWKRLTNTFQSATGQSVSTLPSEAQTPSDSYCSFNDGQHENPENSPHGGADSRTYGPTGNSSIPERRRHRRTSALLQQRDNSITQPILVTGAPSSQPAADGPPARVSSVEEELTRESFFFREPNCDQSSGNHALFPSSSASNARRAAPFRSSFQTLIRDSTHQEFAYRDAAAMHVALAPPVLSSYRTKYEALNRTLERPVGYGYDDDEDDDLSEEDSQVHHLRASDHDLELTASDETEVEASASRRRRGESLSKVTRTDSAALSSLLYRDRGRVLLKLPSDQVRLVMDPDLHPGILSVEQWRRGEREYTSETSRPALHYVLTVPDDLYRRIVGELSDSVTNPYCGMSKCCSEKEFVDIRVAVAITGATLGVLLLLTFAWPVT